MSFSAIPFTLSGKDSEIQELQIENMNLRGQVEELLKEKQEILRRHSDEKKEMKENLKEMQERLVQERKMFRTNILELTQQLDFLKKSVDKMMELRLLSSLKQKDQARHEAEVDRFSKSSTKIPENFICESSELSN